MFSTVASNSVNRSLSESRARLAPRRSAPDSEGLVGVRRAVDEERVWVVEDVGVAVGGRVPHRRLVARGNRLVTELDGGGGGAAEVVDRRLPAQHLLDRRRHQSRIPDQAIQCVGVAEQREEPVRRRGTSGLVARDDQEHEEQRELQVGRVSGRRPRRRASRWSGYQWVGPFAGGHLAGVAVDLDRGLHRGLGSRRDLGVLIVDQRMAQLVEPMPVPPPGRPSAR